jgi:glyoxylase-like metal-dependent hydrolase (beta-lactamase superfamily II)
MSEPKTVARQVDEVLPGLFHYQIQDDRINHISEAYALVEGGTVTLIDPLPLEVAALGRLGQVAAIVLGSPSHQRSAWRYRKETRAKVHAPAGATSVDEAPDVTFKEGDRLPGGLRAIAAPGPKGPHFALHLDRGPGAVFVTDLMMNEPDKGIVFLSDKYMQEPKRGPESARRLLDLKFDVLCFGHGAPIAKGGRGALEDFLKRSAR